MTSAFRIVPLSYQLEEAVETRAGLFEVVEDRSDERHRLRAGCGCLGVELERAAGRREAQQAESGRARLERMHDPIHLLPVADRARGLELRETLARLVQEELRHLGHEVRGLVAGHGLESLDGLGVEMR